VLRVLQRGLEKQQEAFDALQREIDRKKELLVMKQKKLSELRSEVQLMEGRAAEHALITQQQQSATLSEFLGLTNGPTMSSQTTSRTAKSSGSDASHATKNEWLKDLRQRHGENLYDVFKPSHANPLTMLLSPKANFGHRRDEARRTLDTISHLSPVKNFQESYNGAAEEALFDVAKVAAASTALEMKIERQRQSVRHRDDGDQGPRASSSFGHVSAL
jgi:hypothetical protein